jgi:FecR protein
VKRLVAYALIMIAVVACNARLADSSDFDVSVSAYGGTVEVIRGESRLEISLAMRLERGDILEVGSDGYVQLLFSGGALTTGRSNSRMQLASQSVVRLISGESYYHIEPQLAKSFTVETENATVQVHGTQFRVAFEDNATHVATANGLVLVRFGEQEVMLPAGQEIFVDELLSSVQNLSLSDITLSGFRQMHFTMQEDFLVPSLPSLEPTIADVVDIESAVSVPTPSPDDSVLIGNLRQEIQQLRLAEAEYRAQNTTLTRRLASMEELYRIEQALVARYRGMLEQAGIATDGTS